MQQYALELMRRWNLHPFLWNLLLLLFSVVVWLLITLGLHLFVRKQQGEGKNFMLFQSLLRHMSQPVHFFLPLFVFNLLLPVMQVSRVLRNQIGHAVEVLLIISFSWGLIRLIKVAQEYTNSRVDIHQENNLRQRRLITQLQYLRRVGTSLIVLLTIGAILLTFNTLRTIGTGLLTGVGVGGIIVGFAAQRSLGNLLAGFQIAFTQPIRIDDEVVVNNEFGWIEEITLTYVVLRIWDDRRMILPINHFIEEPFENWTRTSGDMQGTVFFYVDYTLPVEPVREVFKGLVAASPLWDGYKATLIVSDLKENVMELRAVVSAKSSGDVFDLRAYIREALMAHIREQYPHCLPKQRTDLKEIPGHTPQAG